MNFPTSINLFTIINKGYLFKIKEGEIEQLIIVNPNDFSQNGVIKNK